MTEGNTKYCSVQYSVLRQAASDPAAAVAAWATATLQVPAGLLRGQPFALADWQVDWLRGALASGIREAGLSVARKNGKSSLVAALVLAHLAARGENGFA